MHARQGIKIPQALWLGEEKKCRRICLSPYGKESIYKQNVRPKRKNIDSFTKPKFKTYKTNTINKIRSTID